MQFPMTRLLRIFRVATSWTVLEFDFAVSVATLNRCGQFFFLILITFVGKQLCLIVYELRLCDQNMIQMLKIAKIFAVQASALPLKNSCGASAIASEIVGAQVPTSDYSRTWSVVSVVVVL